MKASVLSRTLHKWLALFVGLQLVLWTLSGFYMVVVDLDFIHGDPLVRNLRVPLVAQSPQVPFADITRRYPDVTQVALQSLPEQPQPVYRVTTRGHAVMVDASSGAQLSPLSPIMVRALARAYYAGNGEIASVHLLERDPPSEIPAAALPVWRVDFDDWLETSLYVDPDTGTLKTRRHRFWRWFDFLWMLHIMDYEARSDVNNNLLRVVTIAGGVTVMSGLWLLFFSFRRRRPVRA